MRLTRRKAFILQRIIACWIAMAWTGDAIFCVSTGLPPLLNIDGNSISLCADGKSRDAKFCVSQGSSAIFGSNYMYDKWSNPCSGDAWNVLDLSNESVCLNGQRMVARETQDFASLLGWRRYFYHSDKPYRDYSRKNTLSRCFWFNIYFFRFDYDWHCNIRDLFLQ